MKHETRSSEHIDIFQQRSPCENSESREHQIWEYAHRLKRKKRTFIAHEKREPQGLWNSQSLPAIVQRSVLMPTGEKWFPEPGINWTDFRSVTYAPVFDGRKSKDPSRCVSLLATMDSISVLVVP